MYQCHISRLIAVDCLLGYFVTSNLGPPILPRFRDIATATVTYIKLVTIIYVIVIPLCTVEYTSVSRVYSTVDSGITNLIQDPCKLSGASSGC